MKAAIPTSAPQGHAPSSLRSGQRLLRVFLTLLLPPALALLWMGAEPPAERTTAASSPPSGIQSDDFCESTLDPVWQFYNPSGGSLALTGSQTSDAWLEISVPDDQEHQLWVNGIQAPHVLQAANNTDFEIEVKMESPVNAPQFQMQGVVIKQNDYNFLRFEIYSTNAGMSALGAILQSATNTFPLNGNVSYSGSIGTHGTAPIYMRVKREGNLWTHSYSLDGATWQTAGTLTHTLTVTEVGIYGGNAGNNPNHTAQFDYFKEVSNTTFLDDGCAPAPILAPIGDLHAVEGSVVSIDISATDPNGNDADITFSETGIAALPFATLTGNGDGTATLQLTPQSGDAGTYPVSVTATDSEMLTDSENFKILISRPGTGPSNLVSDDFFTGVLLSHWTFEDPKMDGGTYQLTGIGSVDAWLEISVPGNDDHELWTGGIEAPNVQQDANDTGFEIEVKMESPVNSQFQEQGVLVKQDDNNFLRFEIYSNNTNTMALSAILSGSPLTGTITYNDDIGNLGIAPIYMRVKREGDQWTQTYSFDQVNWLTAGSFLHPMTVTSVGLYSGNAGGNPAHTAQFDYFQDQYSPIPDEDNASVLPVELTAFTVRPLDNTAVLHWITATELNNDYFEVQHSTDGRTFRPVGNVPGKGTTQQPQDYEFVHRSPAPGINYYRLRQVDYDGQHEYSPVRSVSLRPAGALRVYPSPADDFLFVEAPPAWAGKIMEVTNSYGRTLFTGPLTGARTRLAVGSWPAGVYLLRISGETAVAVRFVKR